MRCHAGALVAVAIALAACGGSAPPPASAPAHAKDDSPSGGAAADDVALTREPTSVEEARAQIARAEADLRGSLESSKKAESERPEEKPSASPPPPAPPARESKALSEAPSCRTPCQALRSMRRAVDALCRMTGDTDGRCLDARKTLATSEVRAVTCGC